MNPFGPPPPNARGLRGFKSAIEARASGVAQPDVPSFAVMEHKGEYAWVGPADIVMARMTGCMLAHINVLEMVQK